MTVATAERILVEMPMTFDKSNLWTAVKTAEYVKNANCIATEVPVMTKTQVTSAGEAAWIRKSQEALKAIIRLPTKTKNPMQLRATKPVLALVFSLSISLAAKYRVKY